MDTNDFISNSYCRVATACPQVAIGDVATNIKRHISLIDEAKNNGVSILTFPELSLCGYTIGDMVSRKDLLDACLEGLNAIVEHSKNHQINIIVGLPLQVGNNLYNCAVLVSNGAIKGCVPKVNLPTYKEFYEKRWFASPVHTMSDHVVINSKQIPFGTDILFATGDVLFGVEICEDLWIADSPSIRLAAAGALIICNPSASPEHVGKSSYRKDLVRIQSAKLVAGYVYASCDESESTTDIVMSGHCIIADNGTITAERGALQNEPRLQIADIDIDHLLYDRRKDTNYHNITATRVVDCGNREQVKNKYGQVSKTPFLPNGKNLTDAIDTIVAIQSAGLRSRIQNSHSTNLVIGLSGGLDSTLALLVAIKAFDDLGLPRTNITALTMPANASSKRTQTNATKLATALGVISEVIPIRAIVAQELSALKHDPSTQDITYENVQARARTALLFNKANQIGQCLVLGTGDLSELALGWCTYNGDHMSSYNVNASVPKTLVKSIVQYFAHSQSEDVATILNDIVDTPISPELTKQKGSSLSQETEQLVGPYVLHDFFMYYFVRWQDSAEKIYFLAREAFSEAYSDDEIKKWLTVFLLRFHQQQFKRSALPDGPKIGSVSLSPRGDWRMPSDYQYTLPVFLQESVK